MSYARFSEGDVYLIGTLVGTEQMFYCCGCLLNAKEWVDDEDAFLGGFLRSLSGESDFMSPSRMETFKHLQDHLAAGHSVPEHALDEIVAETEWGTP